MNNSYAKKWDIMKDNCVIKEEIVRTWHIEKECKDYRGGPCKYLGLFMRDVVFQNDEYVKTVVRCNPFHIPEIYDEKLSSVSYEELEKKCEELAYGSNWEILVEENKKPSEILLGILKWYDKKQGTVDLEPKNGKLKKGRLVIPIDIARKLDDKTKLCNIYHDEEEGDVFIHFNTKKPVVKSEGEIINNRKYKS